MSEWILILTLLQRYDGGASIHSIQFKTKAACVSAGDAWKKDVEKYYIRSAVCVEAPK